jgi:RES domain-containing protein
MYTAARWTPQGIRSVYTAESLALASLEVFVHTESDKIPLIAIRAFIPEEVAIEEIKTSDLPSNWQSIEAYPQLQKIGKDWLLSQRTPVLKVPSAIVPIESNYILNPAHADLNIVLDPPIQFQFDCRMWKAP